MIAKADRLIRKGAEGGDGLARFSKFKSWQRGPGFYILSQMISLRYLANSQRLQKLHKSDTSLKGFLLASVLFAFSSALNGAAISMQGFYIGNADEKSPAPLIYAQNYFPMYTFGGYRGLSGGEMLISLNEGESVVSATIQAAWDSTLEGLDVASYSKFWALTLTSAYPLVGTGIGDQMWKQLQPHGEGPNFLNFGMNPPKLYIKAKFEVVTSQGTFVDDNGGGGYRMTTVPEPCTPLFLAVSLGWFFTKRWRYN